MEKNEDDEVNQLLQRRKQLIAEYGNKEMSEDKFDEEMKIISEKIADLNNKRMSTAKIEKKKILPEFGLTNPVEKVRKEENIMAEEVVVKKKRGRQPGTVLKPKVEKTDSMKLESVIKYLKEQSKPKDGTKELKKAVVAELRGLIKKIKDM
jgi:hypothetical protein